MAEAADAVEKAVRDVLSEGWRTATSLPPAARAM